MQCSTPKTLNILDPLCIAFIVTFVHQKWAPICPSSANQIRPKTYIVNILRARIPRKIRGTEPAAEFRRLHNTLQRFSAA